MSYAETKHRPEVALVTGATGGFGVAIVQRLAAIGTRIILHGRSEERLTTLAESLPVPTHIVAADVRDRERVAELIAAVPEPFAQVDLLVNNAGLALGGDPAQASSFDDWDEMIETNCKGLAFLTNLILPGMVARGRGHIVNMSSIAGTYPYPTGNVYCATKAFVTQFSLALKADLIATGVRVTSIEPGMVETDFSLVRFKGDAERARKVYADTTPLTAADIAEAVLWVSTLPSHVNINRIEVMPVTQGSGPFSIHRYS